MFGGARFKSSILYKKCSTLFGLQYLFAWLAKNFKALRFFMHANEMTEIRVKGFKAFQSSRICHRNLYNLHLLSNSPPAKTWLSTWNRPKLVCLLRSLVPYLVWIFITIIIIIILLLHVHGLILIIRRLLGHHNKKENFNPTRGRGRINKKIHFWTYFSHIPVTWKTWTF